MNLPLLFLLLFLGSVAGLAGGLLLIVNSSFARANSIHLISFAAGVMLAVTFLDILPEAFTAGGESVFLLSLVGLVVFFLVEDFILHFHHHEGHEHKLSSIVPLILTSDAVHNAIDGVVITASFIADARLGTVVALATFFHEIPQEIGDFAVLISAGVSKAKALFYNFLTALATFLGAILTLILAEKSQGLIGPLLGLAAGMFLYISTADILPEIVKGTKSKLKWQTAGFFLSGVLLIYFLTKIMPA